MARTADELLDAVLDWPDEQRATLVELLNLSHDDRTFVATLIGANTLPPGVTQAEVDAAWEAEIARRMDDVRSGRVQTVPWEVVRRQIDERVAAGEPVPRRRADGA